MAVNKRGGTWWYEFIFAGKRVRESAKTSRKTIALESERQRRMQLERTLAGMPVEKRGNLIKSVAELVRAYAQGHTLKLTPLTTDRLPQPTLGPAARIWSVNSAWFCCRISRRIEFAATWLRDSERAHQGERSMPS